MRQRGAVERCREGAKKGHGNGGIVVQGMEVVTGEMNEAAALQMLVMTLCTKHGPISGPERDHAFLSLSGVGIDDRCGLPQLLQLQSGGYADTDLRDCQQSLESNPAETGKNAEREEAAGGAEGTRTVSDMFEPQIC